MKMAGVKSINVSLDSLQKDRFLEITRRDDFEKVMKNIQLLKKDFHVKINAVLMRGINDDEIIDFVKYAAEEDIEVRFIEFMPFTGNSWDDKNTITKQEILDKVMHHFPTCELTQMTAKENDTSKTFHLSGLKAKFGVISTVSNPFCDSCNRLRLTADGKLKNCLFSGDEMSLLAAHREGIPLKELILSSVKSKNKGLGGLDQLNNSTVKELSNRPMIAIGG
jgi:cyclic pyranopterin phosphate synthase